jgi:hypothetical protein
MFRHDVDPPSSGGTAVAGQLGIDNITAVAGPTVFPDLFSASRGILRSGTLQSLFYSDEDKVVIEEAPPFTPIDASCQITMEGTSPLTTVSVLRFKLETSTSAVPATAVPQRLELFNYATNLYEVVDLRQCTAADNTITITPTGDPNRFIQGGTRKMRARVGLYDPGSLFNLGWRLRVDLGNWLLEP